MKFMKKKNNKGFSLVELIVVIAIMAVLVGVLAPSFMKYVESSRQSTDIQNVEQLKTAVETRCADLEYTNKVEIEITGGTGGTAVVTFYDASGDADDDVDLDSTSKTLKLKSSKWNETAFTYSYDPISATWSGFAASDSDDHKASADPKKDMDSVFKN
jgi:type IV pilus assembly protein PilA